MDEYRATIRMEFTLIAPGPNEAENRLAFMRSWIMKAAGYLYRRGWIDGPSVMVEDPVKTGERRIADGV